MVSSVSRGARYLVLLLSVGLIIFLVLFSGIGSVTGNVSADFIFQKRLIEGEPLSGSLRIAADEVLPIDSIVVLRMGKEVVEKPLYFLLDEEQRAALEQGLVIYPEVKVDLEVIVSSPTSEGTSVPITGSVTGKTISIVGSSSGSSGSDDAPVYSAKTSVVASTGGGISFEKNTVIDEVIFKSAKLNDGTPIPLALVSYNIIDNKVNVISDYKESVNGFSENKVLRIPLSAFDVKTRIGEIAISIKYKGEDLLNGGEKVYAPISVRSTTDSDLKEVVFGRSREQVLQITDCGEVKCSLKECVLPNFDSNNVLSGDIEKGLVNVVTCSNLCASNKEIYSCEQKKSIEIAVDSAGEGFVVLDVIDKSSDFSVGKINANFEGTKIKRLDITFNN